MRMESASSIINRLEPRTYVTTYLEEAFALWIQGIVIQIFEGLVFLIEAIVDFPDLRVQLEAFRP